MARDEEREAERGLGREALAYADALHNLARYLTGNDRDAEDLVQETYARALKGAGQFMRGSNLKAWLFRILRNTFISEYRRRRNDPTTGGLDTVDESGMTTSEPPLFLDDRELDRLRSVVAEDIQRALMALGDDARSVILLDLEGFSETEMAQIVGCAVGTVKSRLSRARAALRVTLKDYAK
jgi:RNA polymerase sigma-70 factor (ECF subfamily)